MVEIYFNNDNVTDISALKNKWEAWTLAKTATIARSCKSMEINFPVPFSARQANHERDSDLSISMNDFMIL